MYLLIQNSRYRAAVDDEDYTRLMQYKWYLCGNSKSFSVKRLPWINGKTKNIPLANEIMHNYSTTFDHKDRNPLNNIKANIRECTYSQNNANKEKMYKGSSIFKGVDFHKVTGKWRARISFRGKTLNLGSYSTDIEAAKVYNDKALEIYGEFAVINKLS